MSRSKHTDPKAVRAARRIYARDEGRGAGDLSQRRALKLRHQDNVAASREHQRLQNVMTQPRITLRRPRRGFHHPASGQDVLGRLHAIGPIAFYGLRSVDLARLPDNTSTSKLVFGRYHAPGRIILFEQPMTPWRLPGLLKPEMAHLLVQAGAVVTRSLDPEATCVDWPEDTLRQFMLKHVLLHELGHHVLQHYKGKRRPRIARTRDHEAFAARFAEKHRAALLKGKSH